MNETEFKFKKSQKAYFFFKRAIALFGSSLGIILLSPILIFAAIMTKCTSKGPVLFKQVRMGKDEKPFVLYKFRSMRIDAPKVPANSLTKDEQRIMTTRWGAFMRKTSIDELPQLVNILKGDMALIGPRPALTYHPWPYDQYTEHQKHMFDVLPGVTGWAQVHGRKEVPWPERIELNVWYAQHMSLWLDVKIFFMTIFKVVTNANNENIGETGIKK